jgi:AraC-like DNA-binding protein
MPARSEVERRVLGMIESGTPYNIGDLAAELRLSPSHLQRLFKRETGSPMGEWLIELRLQKAAYLLAKSYLSVKEVARSAGYEHVSSFIRAFERRYVLTPTQYRERADSASSVDSYLGRTGNEMLSIPQIVLIDRAGMIRVVNGGQTDPTLEDINSLRLLLEPLLKESPPNSKSKI